MSSPSVTTSLELAQPPAAALGRPAVRTPSRLETGLKALLPVAAAALALTAHRYLPNRQSPLPTHTYPTAITLAMAAAIGSGLLALDSDRWARWYTPRAPLAMAALLTLLAWDLITLKMALLPLPYFPGPDMVFQSLVEDRQLLLESTYYSLRLLMTGYAIGVAAGFLTGVMVGWFPLFRYWVMPLLKLVGPVPATAWIPLALMLMPTTFLSGVSLIALAVWFPVTMLTASGISNVRVSYLDVARTLGASRWFLISRVAIPSALPNVFLGLFMGLGASFLTLIVAEMLGVKSGLGWYISWAQGWAEYSKVYAALLIMMLFFSTLMTLLFVIRDWALVWQKGVLKW